MTPAASQCPDHQTQLAMLRNMFIPRPAAAATLASLILCACLHQFACATPEVLAVTTTQGGFSPRFYMLDPVRRPEKRQEGGSCPGHNCAELGDEYADVCCENDRYCFLDRSWEAKCCAVGNDCEGDQSTNNPCPSMNYCNATITVSASTTESAGCCPRACGTASQHCASSFGGHCCDLNDQCASSSQCLVSQSSTSSMSTVVGIVPSGCTATTQFRCDESDIGLGCCAIGQSCVAGTNVCAGDPALPTSSGSYTIDQSTGLSEPARIGVGVGVAVGAALIIGLLTWFCIRRRQAHRQSTQTGSNMDSGGGYHMRQRPGGGPGIGSPGREGDIMSEMSGPTSEGAVVSSAGRSHPHRSGLARDYFGPEGVAGPFTENPDTPRGDLSLPDRGVPVIPQGPADIAVPVEIDSHMGNQGITAGAVDPRQQMQDAGDERRADLERSGTPGQKDEEREGPFELAGSEWPSPSPLSPEDERSIAPRDDDRNAASMAGRAAVSPSPEPSVALSVSPEPGQRPPLERDSSRRSRAP